jgi:asparagine synthase (glutamine-hydrolysing)
MSMAHGLEVRLPLLDHRLVEFVLSLPSGWLVGPLPTEGKRILRRLVGPMLPEGILNRPKHGFVIPLNDWIRRFWGRMLFERIESGSSRISKYLDQQAMVALLNRPVGIQSREDLYALLILELWLERFVL